MSPTSIQRSRWQQLKKKKDRLSPTNFGRSRRCEVSIQSPLHSCGLLSVKVWKVWPQRGAFRLCIYVPIRLNPITFFGDTDRPAWPLDVRWWRVWRLSEVSLTHCSWWKCTANSCKYYKLLDCLSQWFLIIFFFSLLGIIFYFIGIINERNTYLNFSICLVLFFFFQISNFKHERKFRGS